MHTVSDMLIGNDKSVFRWKHTRQPDWEADKWNHNTVLLTVWRRRCTLAEL